MKLKFIKLVTSNIVYNYTPELTANTFYSSLSLNKSANKACSYYAYGSQQPGRIFNSQSYAYAFNGKELDREGMGGGGSTYDYGFRIYNPQLGKFLSVDPLTKKYPMLSTYQYASNTPIQAIDLDGLEAAVQTTVAGINSLGKDFVVSSTFSTIEDKSYTPNKRYGDKGVLFVYTHLDVPEKSYEVYSSLHAEVKPTKWQNLKNKINKFSYDKDIYKPVENAVIKGGLFFNLQVNPLGRAMNTAGLLEPNQTENVVTGEDLGGVKDRVLGGVGELAGLITLPRTLVFNASESLLTNSLEGNEEETAKSVNSIAKANYSIGKTLSEMEMPTSRKSLIKNGASIGYNLYKIGKEYKEIHDTNSSSVGGNDK